MASVAHVNRATKRFQLGTVLNRVMAMLRDCMMAIAYGTDSAVGAFVIAYRIFSIPGVIIREGAMRAAIIPAFERISGENEREGATFIRDLAVASFVYSVGLIILCEILLGILLGTAGFTHGTNQILILSMIVAPSVIPTVVLGLSEAYLNSKHYYFVTSASLSVFSAIWAITVAIFWYAQVWSAMKAVSASIVVGMMVACLINLATAFPLAWRTLGKDLWHGLSISSKEVRRIALPMAFAIVSFSAQQINLAINPIFARILEPSGPAYLYYANRIEIFVLALIGFAMVGGILPSLTRVIQAKNQHRYEVLLTYALRRSTELMVPTMVGLFLFGLPLVNLLFGRGNFVLRDLVLTSQCLWAAAFGIVPRVITLIQISVFYAHSRFKEPGWVGLATIMINLVLNLAFTLPIGLEPWWVVFFSSIATIG